MVKIHKAVFGIPLPASRKNEPDFQRPLQIEEALRCGAPGFLRHGAPHDPRGPGAFGVASEVLGDEGDCLDLRGLRVTPTLPELEAFDALWQQLGHEMRQLVGSFGLPRLFVMTASL